MLANVISQDKNISHRYKALFLNANDQLKYQFCENILNLKVCLNVGRYTINRLTLRNTCLRLKLNVTDYRLPDLENCSTAMKHRNK